MMSESFSVYDTTLSVWSDQFGRAEEVFAAIKAKLGTLGFGVGPDPYVELHYKTLGKHRRHCERGDLKCKLALNGIHVEAKFYQDVNAENRNGGEYDFDKLRRMPYLVRLRYLLVIRALRVFVQNLGYRCSEKRSNTEANPPPLVMFNDGWGADRFRRGPDGWPDDVELKSWDRKDGDGVAIRQGDVRFVPADGRYVRLTVYGGINGMWLGYGSDGALWSNTCACFYRSKLPGRGRHFSPYERLQKLRSHLKRAVRDRRFLAAHGINAAMEHAERLKEIEARP